MNNELALKVTDLHVTYGDFVAVQQASFSIPTGECVAIIGPNGNGKSSIAMAVAGLISSTGSVEVFGETAPRADPVWMVKHGLALVPERRQLFPKLTVDDNILLGCYSWTRSIRKARSSGPYNDAVELFPELKTRLRQQAGTLSGGQQQMAALARGLAANPKILVTDEPCLGLAEVVAHRLYQALAMLNHAGRTIVLIEENPARALQISSQTIYVESGVVVKQQRISAEANRSVEPRV